jgi:hypothetical protein
MCLVWYTHPFEKKICYMVQFLSRLSVFRNSDFLHIITAAFLAQSSVFSIFQWNELSLCSSDVLMFHSLFVRISFEKKHRLLCYIYAIIILLLAYNYLGSLRSSILQDLVKSLEILHTSGSIALHSCALVLYFASAPL